MHGHGVGGHVQAEVEQALAHQGRQVQGHLAHHARPVLHGGGVGGAGLAQLFGLGQGQHLVGQLGGGVDGVFDFLQGLGRGHVAPAGRLHLHLEHGQRRAQLVRGVAHKAFLVGQQVAQAGHVLVGGFQQGQQLLRCALGGQGRQVALAAGGQGRAELAHRAGGALHHPHHHGGNQRQQCGLPPQGVEQDVAGHGFAQLQGFGHLHSGHALAALAGHGLAQHGHAHGLVAVAVVVKLHQRGIHRLCGLGVTRGRQVGEARHHFVGKPGHAVEDAAAVVGLKGLQR